VTGFGGHLLKLGGDLLGGEVGQRAQQLGSDAEWLRDGTRGRTRDRALGRAVDEVAAHFQQCNRCGQWVCQPICWNGERGLCTACAPKLDQEIAGRQASAQLDQLNQKIGQVDWTKDVNQHDPAVARCPACQGETGGGRFCQHCGTALAAAPGTAHRFCGTCGTALGPAAVFCAECGTATA
jgi:hypothetical protein